MNCACNSRKGGIVDIRFLFVGDGDRDGISQGIESRRILFVKSLMKPT